MVRRLIPWVLGLGVAARVTSFLANRSLWLDEAMIALNIERRSWADLVGTLDFNQAAPLGFLWLEKLAVVLLGASERALRLWPLVAAIVGLFLFDELAKRVMRPAARLFTVAAFALSGSLVYYAGEVKQYSFDVTFAALLLCAGLMHGIALGRKEAGSRESRPADIGGADVGGADAGAADAGAADVGDADPTASWLALAGVGVIGVWFSHPLIFVLPGILVYLYGVPGPRSERLRPLAIIALFWGASFAAAFLLTARGASQSAVMARFWLDGFVPVPPTSGADLAWFPDALGGWIRNLLDYSETVSPVRTVGIWAGAGLALTGIARGWLQDRRVLTLIALPIALTLLASALHLYPFKGRLILFLVPSTCLLIGWGLEAGLSGLSHPNRTSGGPVAIPAAAVALATLVAAAGLATLAAAAAVTGEWLRAPYREELRPVLTQIAARVEPGDVIYLHSGAQHAALFYQRTCERCRFDSATVVRGGFLSGREEAIEAELARLPLTGRLWAVFSHEWWGYGDLERDRLVAELERRAGRPDVFTAPGVEAFLFDLRWGALGAAVRGGRLSEATGLGRALATDAWARGRLADAHRAALQPAYLTLYGLGDVAGAIASAERVLETWPFDRSRPESGLVLADFFVRAGQADRARALAEVWERSREDGVAGASTAEHERLRALLALALGDPGAAAARLRQPGSRADGCNSCADFDLAVALDVMSAADSAIAAYERYVRAELEGGGSPMAFGTSHALRRLVALHRSREERLGAEGDREAAALAGALAREYADRLATLWAHADPELRAVMGVEKMR